VESRSSFTKGREPPGGSRRSGDTFRAQDPKDKEIARLRARLDAERLLTREARQRLVYQNYWSRPVSTYHDPYNNFFWWWLLDQSADRRAGWAYHHRYDMDPARYSQLQARDAQLESRLRQLESHGVARDSTYAPDGIDHDLMYSDDFVTSVYNTQAPAPPADSASSALLARAPRSGGATPNPLPVDPASTLHRPGGRMRPLLMVVFVGVSTAVLIWLVFFKRWGGPRR
jgi:hypothetical protein